MEEKPDMTETITRGAEMQPLDPLPVREWLKATLNDVDYRYSMYQGQQQYVTDMDGNKILDSEGNPIKRKEFNITFLLDDYEMPNGENRKAWLSLGASLSDKAHLPEFLKKIGIDVPSEITPMNIIAQMQGIKVRLQVKEPRGEKGYQSVIWDSVEKTSDPTGWEE